MQPNELQRKPSRYYWTLDELEFIEIERNGEKIRITGEDVWKALKGE